MRILVCGGRDYRNKTILYSVLEDINSQHHIEAIIEGDAQGADRIAGWWAQKNGVKNEKYVAEWNKYGKSAGHIRNKRMIDEGKPTLVIAFPGGAGTKNMIEQAEKAGIEVRKIGE